MNNTILICFTLFLLFFVSEKIFPARKLMQVQTWFKRVIFINIFQIIIIIIAGISWDKFFMKSSFLNLSDYYTDFTSALLSYLVITFIFYWWHRIRHEFNFFWLSCHQLHHSPQRLETITSFYKHPLEIVINSLLISAISYGLLGLSYQAASLTIIMTAFGEYFYHANIKTPYLLGYIIQRPEMHRIHHQTGSHHYNYSDIPLWDILFGTFKNPQTDDCHCGFENNLEQKFLFMLTFKDVFRKAKIKGDFKYTLIVLLGLLQIFGYLTGQEKIKGLGTVSVAAPLPIVFSTVNGLETFSQEFHIETLTTEGKIIRKTLNSKNYNRIKAPYNLRNVYGFSMAYGAAIDNQKLVFVRDQILDYAFCSGKSSMSKILDKNTEAKAWRLDVTSRAYNHRTTLQLEGLCK
jgi:sterol desaturase/sphingolipid hydroxylase (fatty acid hydroxylase superfamily)